jgi:hypothetical protein
MLSNEISPGGLRDRVTACRKRLRENRVTLKAHNSTSDVELFPEARPKSSPFEGGELDETSLLMQVEGQEVGIT